MHHESDGILFLNLQMTYSRIAEVSKSEKLARINNYLNQKGGTSKAISFLPLVGPCQAIQYVSFVKGIEPGMWNQW